MWLQGIVLCVEASAKWTLTIGGPKLGGSFDEKNIIKKGVATAVGFNSWHTITLMTQNDTASGKLDNVAGVSSSDQYDSANAMYVSGSVARDCRRDLCRLDFRDLSQELFRQ